MKNTELNEESGQRIYTRPKWAESESDPMESGRHLLQLLLRLLPLFSKISPL
jgi:hypothetical protein